MESGESERHLVIVFYLYFMTFGNNFENKMYFEWEIGCWELWDSL